MFTSIFIDHYKIPLYEEENIYSLKYLVCKKPQLSTPSSSKPYTYRSTFDNLELLKDGLSGALVTGLIIGVHEIGHILAARESGIKLGVPYFVPSWQVKTLYKKKISELPVGKKIENYLYLCSACLWKLFETNDKSLLNNLLKYVVESLIKTVTFNLDVNFLCRYSINMKGLLRKGL